MTQPMVVSFFPDGTVQHTLKDEQFDPFPGQPRHVARMTEILPTEDGRAFYIKWLLGPCAGKIHTLRLVYEIMALVTRSDEGDRILRRSGLSPEETVFYPTYAEAVEAEIAVVNILRRLGVSFA